MRISDWSSDVCSSDLSGHLQNSSTQRLDRSRKLSLPGCHRRPQRSSMRYWTRFGEIGVSLKLLTLGRNGQGVQCVYDQIVVSIPLRAQSPLRTLDRGRIGGRDDRQGYALGRVGADRNEVSETWEQTVRS